MESFKAGMKAGSAKAPARPTSGHDATPEVDDAPKKTRESRAPPRPAAPVQDIETVVGIAERLYHLPGGKNGNGVVGQTCARLREWLEKMK